MEGYFLKIVIFRRRRTYLRYFNYLSAEEEKELFHLSPMSFDNNSEKEMLAHAVGAALYMPATRQTIAEDLLMGKIEGLVSMVIDLEDAIGDYQIDIAEDSLVQQMFRIASYIENGMMSLHQLPLIFIRVRTSEQLQRIIDKLEENVELITGFAFPKFSSYSGASYFEIIDHYNRNQANNRPVLYGMPILETSDVIFKESRLNALLGIKSVLDLYADYVLNVRIGATDFSSLFGLRRSADMTIYDIGPIRDCMADIVNLFGRMPDGQVISGPVWEYFKSDRVFKPQLRESPFKESMGPIGRKVRNEFISGYMDGLLREVVLDKENGIIGKTIIHPTHIKPVQCLYAVTHEEYMDATTILANNNGFLGVLKSQYANKMNEIKPHLNWAKRIMIRSKIYGVLHEQHNFTSLLTQSKEVYV